MRLSRFCLAAACAGLLALPAAAAAQDEAGAGDPVVARVNGEPIHYSEVMETAERLPQQYQARIKEILPALVDRLIDLKLLEDAAAEAGLADDPEVERRLARLEPEVMRDVYLERRVEDYMSAERLKRAYGEYREENPPQTEVKARHILLESEEDARQVIGELEAGADFAALAKERSTGPSAARGGDLGYFTRGEMVPAFSEAAFALEPGEYTDEPVESQFGWHVVKVEDRRTKQPKTLEEMEGQLREEMQREAVESLLSELRSGASVEKFPEATDLQPQDSGGEDPDAAAE